MKNLFEKIKWVAAQAKNSTLYLFLIVLFGATCSAMNIYRAIVLKMFIDSSIQAQTDKVLKFAILFAILVIVDVGLSALLSVIVAYSSTKITNLIQKRLYTHLTKTRWLEFSRYHSGNILTKLTNDVDAVTNVIVNTFPNIISLGVMLIGSFITMLFINKSLAIVAIILAPLTILISRLYAGKLKTLYNKFQEIEAEYRSFLHESLQNMVIIKTFCCETNNTLKLENIQKKRIQSVLSRSRMNAFSNTAFSLSSWIGFFIVFGWGSINLSTGAITFGTLTALLQLFGNIQGPFSNLTHSLPQIIYSLASAERLMDLEALDIDSNDSIVQNITSAGIQFENVSFYYKNNEPVLKNASAKINPGETVALIGLSGEGKTTLLRLLLSLVYPQKGNAFITHGEEKTKISPSCRKFISYVPQGNTLFSGTISDNLRIGNPEATDREIEAAARASCAWEFIENLPEGLNSVLGEHGLGISEGQAQRLAIARSLLHKTPILILDEATSALDINTEIKVLQTIHNLKPARTCIIITHRVTALQICHKILKLEDGCLFETTNTVSDIDTIAI